MLKYPSVNKDSFKKVFAPYGKFLKRDDLKRPDKKENSVDIKPQFLKFNSKKNLGSIKLQGIKKTFGKNVVLDNINLELLSGKVTGIIGISGSGKTTLLKILIGFYKPQKGNILFKSKELIKSSSNFKKIFGFASQENCFYDGLTVKENLEYFGKLYGLNNDLIGIHTNHILKLVNLEDAENSLAGNLSTGMRRRLDIACSLIHDPSVLILDEPTEDLDPALRREMVNLIKKINKTGTTIILTSHLIWELENLCHCVAVLSNGKIVKVGSPQTLRKSFSKNEEIHLESTPGKYKNIVKSLKGFKKVSYEEGKVVLYVPDASKLLPKLLKVLSKKKEKIIEINMRKPSLTEVFEALTKNDRKKFRR